MSAQSTAIHSDARDGFRVQEIMQNMRAPKSRRLFVTAQVCLRKARSWRDMHKRRIEHRADLSGNSVSGLRTLIQILLSAEVIHSCNPDIEMCRYQSGRVTRACVHRALLRRPRCQLGALEGAAGGVE